ncbi:hypothetical protein [Spirulina subsalsa]|uniref:hypothetical protein n=1 Tax=Spirulina subsalsa TaxID=54311 RepID=UPI0002D83193|nr:hypothetical protein [Spirulina subsalsa]
MNPNPESEREQEPDLSLERDILSGRKFSLADVIGREGGAFLKGESPVPPLIQAKAELNQFITQNLQDSSGALQAVLQTWVQNDLRVSQNLEQPLIALRDILNAIASNPEILYELVQQVDAKWGQMYGETPHFQQPGQPPHPDDEYTHASVRHQLVQLLEQVNQAI